jgi:hypothetical protein
MKGKMRHHEWVILAEERLVWTFRWKRHVQPLVLVTGTSLSTSRSRLTTTSVSSIPANAIYFDGSSWIGCLQTLNADVVARQYARGYQKLGKRNRMEHKGTQRGRALFLGSHDTFMPTVEPEGTAQFSFQRLTPCVRGLEGHMLQGCWPGPAAEDVIAQQGTSTEATPYGL